MEQAVSVAQGFTKPDDWYNCECFVCGKKMHRKPYWLNRTKHHVYCSQKCHYIDKHRYMTGEGNHQYGLKGEKDAGQGESD